VLTQRKKTRLVKQSQDTIDNIYTTIQALGAGHGGNRLVAPTLTTMVVSMWLVWSPKEMVMGGRLRGW